MEGSELDLVMAHGACDLFTVRSGDARGTRSKVLVAPNAQVALCRSPHREGTSMSLEEISAENEGV